MYSVIPLFVNLKKVKKIDLGCFELDEVVSALKSIDENSSAGSVNIHSKIIKNCAVELGPSLTKLFNLGLTNSEIPDD
jgi:hypothetical protein